MTDRERLERRIEDLEETVKDVTHWARAAERERETFEARAERYEAALKEIRAALSQVSLSPLSHAHADRVDRAYELADEALSDTPAQAESDERNLRHYADEVGRLRARLERVREWAKKRPKYYDAGAGPYDSGYRDGVRAAQNEVLLLSDTDEGEGCHVCGEVMGMDHGGADGPCIPKGFTTEDLKRDTYVTEARKCPSCGSDDPNTTGTGQIVDDPCGDPFHNWVCTCADGCPVHGFHFFERCDHSFSVGPNCAKCGLHASVVEGGSLSPKAITDKLAAGHAFHSTHESPGPTCTCRDPQRGPNPQCPVHRATS